MLDLVPGIYSIVLTALIMTMFEIAFTNVIVFPSIKRSINRALVRERKYMDSTIHNETDAFLYMLQQREKTLIKKLNVQCYVTLFFMLLVLVVAVLICLSVMRASKQKILAPTALVSVSLVYLIAFQIFFYRVGKNFQYESGLEVQYAALENICKSVMTNGMTNGTTNGTTDDDEFSEALQSLQPSFDRIKGLTRNLVQNIAVDDVSRFSQSSGSPDTTQ